jgi:hypothetical protein
LLKAKAGAGNPRPPGVAAAPAASVRPGGAPGRPVSNIGKYLIKPTAEMDTGFELINADPNVLKEVHQKYLKAGQLPPSLQPKFLRKPEVMEAGRSKAISRGWRKPRSRQG